MVQIEAIAEGWGVGADADGNGFMVCPKHAPAYLHLLFRQDWETDFE